jgi:hypothetical protein
LYNNYHDFPNLRYFITSVAELHDFTGTGAVTGCSSGSDGSGSDCSDSKLDDEDGLIFKKCNAFS